MSELQKTRRKRRTLLLAAALAAALAVTALAVSSVHARRQETLRQELQIEENRVQTYVEYTLPETEAPELHVTPLSAIRSGTEVNVYFNLSPVSRQQMEAFLTGEFFFHVPGDAGWGPVFYKIRSWEGEESLWQAWDEESRTLTLYAAIVSGFFRNDPAEGFELTIGWADPEKAGNVGDTVEVLGTIPVEGLTTESRTVTFAEPLPFRNETTGETGRFLGLVLSPTEADFLLEFPGSEYVYYVQALGKTWPELTEEEQAKAVDPSWIRAEAAVTDGATLTFADGRTFAVPPAESGVWEDGVVRRISIWSDTTIDMAGAVSLTLADGRTVNLS